MVASKLCGHCFADARASPRPYHPKGVSTIQSTEVPAMNAEGDDRIHQEREEGEAPGSTFGTHVATLRLRLLRLLFGLMHVDQMLQ